MLKDFGPKISELEGVTEVIGSSSVVREVRTVDFVFLAVEESLKFLSKDGARFRLLLQKEKSGNTYS